MIHVLRRPARTSSGKSEFAAPSVTSPGLAAVLNLATIPAVLQAEGALTQLVDTLQYVNLANRGYLAMTFTPSQATAEWIFVNSVKTASYGIDNARRKTLSVAVNTNKISL